MRLTSGAVFVFMALALGAADASGQAAQPAPAAGDPVIVSQGEAVLMLRPDRAYVQIGAEGRAAQPAEAQRLAAAAMTGVQAALKALGIPAEAIRTSAYTVQPQYDYQNGRQTFREFLARNVIEVRVDNLDRLPEVIDATGTSGGATVSSLRFDLKNRGAAELDALRRAVRDATDRARAIAEGAGRTLGPILRLQEQRSSPPSPVFRSMAEGAGGRGGGMSTPIEAGEIQVRAQVTLTAAIR
jgi:uncharacterized protein YggE